MKRFLSTWVPLLTVFALTPACGKKDTPAPDTRSSAVVASASATAPVASASAVPAQPAGSAPPSEVSAAAPTDFSSGKEETIDNAIGLGCTAKSLNGWLELFCRKKNGTGGHPVNATTEVPEELMKDAAWKPEPGAPTPEVQTWEADDKRQLKVVIPWRGGAQGWVVLNWSDTQYFLEYSADQAKLTWVAPLEMRKTCAKFEPAQAKLLKDASKTGAPEALTEAESKKLPKLGRCQTAGRGAWALLYRSVTASGSGATRAVTAQIDAVRVRPDGSTVTFDWTASHPLVVAPGGLGLGPLAVYDYDDDGSDELIIPWEQTALPAGQQPFDGPAILSFIGDKIAAASFLPSPWWPGVTSMEQLDPDHRPDLGTYGPYIAYFGSDCGAKKCPARVTGPKLIALATDTGFSLAAPEAKMVAIKACKKVPDPFAKPGALELQAVVSHLACARLGGTDASALQATLSQRAADLCATAEGCPALETLKKMVSAEAPLSLK